MMFDQGAKLLNASQQARRPRWISPLVPEWVRVRIPDASTAVVLDRSASGAPLGVLMSKQLGGRDRA